ncbi:MAG: hypothetical protein AAF738_01380, partial [Bacteroidota bacterium]
ASNEMNFYVSGDYFQESVVSIENVVIKGDSTSALNQASRQLNSVKILSMSSDDDPRVQLSAIALRGEGLENTIGYPDRIEHNEPKIPHKVSQIRYFNKEDKAAAEKLRRFYKENFELDSEILDLSKKLKKTPTAKAKTKGQIEVWIK